MVCLARAPDPASIDRLAQVGFDRQLRQRLDWLFFYVALLFAFGLTLRARALLG